MALIACNSMGFKVQKCWQIINLKLNDKTSKLISGLEFVLSIQIILFDSAKNFLSNSINSKNAKGHNRFFGSKTWLKIIAE